MISDRRKDRLYQIDGERVAQVKLGSIGNLGLFGILADVVSEEIVDGRNQLDTMTRQHRSPYTLWRNVSEAIAKGEYPERLHATSVRKRPS